MNEQNLDLLVTTVQSNGISDLSTVKKKIIDGLVALKLSSLNWKKWVNNERD